jgi:hypothetical protein
MGQAVRLSDRAMAERVKQGAHHGFLRKRKISELIAVEVAQLDSSEPKLDAPETMGCAVTPS